MRNKKKIIAGASVGALAVLAMGAFAFFTYTDTDYVDVMVGTVKVNGDGDGAGLHSYYGEANPSAEGGSEGGAGGEAGEGGEAGGRNEVEPLLDPGDNDPESDDDTRPGTDHELNFGVRNDGTKSIITRAVSMVSICLPVLDDDGNPTGEFGEPIKLTDEFTVGGETITGRDLIEMVLLSTYEGSDYGQSANTETPEGKAKLVLLEEMDPADGAADNAIVYVLGGETILNGVGDNAESEANGVEGDEGINYVIDLGLSKDVTADSPLMGARVTVTVQIQAMQYRNTADSDWATIFTKDYSTVVRTTDHPENHE